MSETSIPTPQPQRKNRSWAWYFLVVFGLSLVAMAVIYGYYWSQQLTQEQLSAASQQWQENGLDSYEMRYVVKRGGTNSPDTYEVRVLKGEVVFGSHNDLPLEVEQLKYRSMTALLGDIQKFMDRDVELGNFWTDCRAIFDKKDGHLLTYKRWVWGSRERVEITVVEFRALEGEGKKK